MNNLQAILPGEVIKRSEIPDLCFNDFKAALLISADNGGCIVHFFGYEEKGIISLMAVMRLGNELYVGLSNVSEKFPCLTRENAKFHLFEREIAEQFGLTPEGHPWLKNVRFHSNWLGKKDVFDNLNTNIPGNYPYFKVEGDEIHEVAVGPVHAGIIEPGHFRFQCIGEKVFHLEIQLGYQHRDIERLMTRIDWHRRPVVAESIAGDTAVANSICYCQGIEALQGIKVSDEVQRVRAVALELERLANHTGDLGALAGDVAFITAAAYFGRMRGEFLNMLLSLCGNRFGKGLVRPGGVFCRWDQNIMAILLKKINEIEPELVEVSDLLFSAHTVLGRFEGCGVVSPDDASGIGLVGFAGRASGSDYDVRFFPGSDAGFFENKRTARSSGDVFARAWIRYEEIIHSLTFIRKVLNSELKPVDRCDVLEGSCQPDSFVVTMTEAWRGELSHCFLTDGQGGLLRYKIKDPSFHNWTGLALALRNEGISDFPLNNKSFNLSYCGFDL